jgi:DNA polymerase III alpha subunit
MGLLHPGGPRRINKRTLEALIKAGAFDTHCSATALRLMAATDARF